MTSIQNDLKIYLKPTWVIDSKSEAVRSKVALLIERSSTQEDKAKQLFYFVRDEVKYNPYLISYAIEDYQASRILQRKEGFCIQKAVLLTALARAVGIPARLGFADIKNHLAPKKLLEKMGTNLFIYHGYSELWLNSRWVKATPAFNIEMCNRFELKPVEFDSVRDAVFHKRSKRGCRHIEYIKYHGTFADLPFEDIMQAFVDQYPETGKIN